MTFSDKSVYPKLQVLEDAYQEIRKEMEAVSHGIKMRTWPEANKFNGSWKVFGLYHGGRKLESCCKLCPTTTATIESLGKVTMAGFSKMDAGTEINWHVDDVEEKLRIHMGLKIPRETWDACGFMVGESRGGWSEGRAFAFDPQIRHCAWNHTLEDRIILLLDFEDFC